MGARAWSVVSEFREGVTILHVRGHVDYERGAPGLETIIPNRRGDAMLDPLIVDLSDVWSMHPLAMAGLARTCVRSMDTGRRVAWSGMRKAIERIFRRAELDARISLHRDPAEALLSLRGH